MGKIFEKLGIKIVDEMEMRIHLKSVQIAAIYSTLFLGIWCFYELTKEAASVLPILLLGTQNLVMFMAQLFFRYQILNSGEDEEISGISKSVVKGVIIAAMMAGFALFILIIIGLNLR